MQETNTQTRARAEESGPGPISTGELALEREKIQIERERLALERERWSAEREKYQENQKLTNRAAGRLTLGISTLTLSLLCALLAGGAIGAWLVALYQQDRGQVTASLIHALGSGTNALSEAEGASPLLRALGRTGRTGGYLLILD
jgi:hypothetical protein